VLPVQEAIGHVTGVVVEQVAVAALHVPAGVKTLPAHEAVPHDMVAAIGQLSVPLQKEARTTLEEPMHIAPLHMVVLPFLAQTPPEAQAPVLPQLPAGAAVHIASMVPAVTDVQVPAEPNRVQDWQAPEQALLQQTPSTQLAAVDTQSAALLHIAPWACFVPHR